MAKARSTTTGASVRARAAAKPRSARATARPVSKSAVKPHKRHRLLGFLATMFALLALAGAAARALPADYRNCICADCGIGNAMVHVAWLDCPAVGHRVAAYPCRTNRHRRNRMQWLLAISVLLLDRSTPPSRAERRGRSLPQHQRCLRARHDLNVYKGQADPQAIVELVRDQRVEVLALQETTEDFVKKLNEAGIEHYLPYAQVSSSDGVSVTASGRPRHLPIRPTMT